MATDHKQIDFSSIQKEVENHLHLYSKNNFVMAIHKGLNYTWVFLLYALGIFALIFPFIANRVFPFHVLSKVSNSEAVILAIGSKPDAQAFVFGVYALMILLGVFIIIIAMMMQKGIAKNSALQQANTILKKANEAMLLHQNQFGTAIEINEKNGTLQSLLPKDLPFVR
jgi:uncharacterized membrane protein